MGGVSRGGGERHGISWIGTYDSRVQLENEVRCGSRTHGPLYTGSQHEGVLVHAAILCTLRSSQNVE